MTASEDQLSLHAWSKDMLQPRHTMNGLEVEDSMTANGSVHSRALQVVLRSQLRSFHESLTEQISTTFCDLLTTGQRQPNGWSTLPSFTLTKSIVTSANCLVFFGPELAKDTEFLEAALAYPEDLVKTAEVLKLMPSFLAPLLAPVLMRHHQASTTLVDRLTPLVEQRIAQSSDPNSGSQPKPNDVIQYLVDGSVRSRDQWSASKIVQVVMGIWFAAVHQPALTLVYALNDLCLHPEFVEPLRAEIADCLQRGGNIDQIQLLDGYLKESARLSPSDSISMRRKVLKPFRFSDGTRLAKDDVACLPLQAILRDPSSYPTPMEFNPYRYLDSTKESNIGSRLTDSNMTFPLWGLGKRTCPGRHYASVLLKLTLAHFLQNYDVQLADSGSEARTFYWRSAIVPRDAAALSFRRRVESA